MCPSLSIDPCKTAIPTLTNSFLNALLSSPAISALLLKLVKGHNSLRIKFSRGIADSPTIDHLLPICDCIFSGYSIFETAFV